MGSDTTSCGLQVAEALAILPDGARFSSADTFVQGVADREGLALKTSGIGDAAVTSALGITDVATVADAAVTDVQAVPIEARAALATGGVTTVGQLSKMTPDQGGDAAHPGRRQERHRDRHGWLDRRRPRAHARAIGAARETKEPIDVQTLI